MSTFEEEASGRAAELETSGTPKVTASMHGGVPATVGYETRN